MQALCNFHGVILRHFKNREPPKIMFLLPKNVEPVETSTPDGKFESTFFITSDILHGLESMTLTIRSN